MTGCVGDAVLVRRSVREHVHSIYKSRQDEVSKILGPCQIDVAEQVTGSPGSAVHV